MPADRDISSADEIPDTFERHVSGATVALILKRRSSDLPSALDIVKRVRELGYRMREAGSRA